MQTKRIVVYGINNCDSVKNARDWLESRQIEYCFHDYRRDGLESALLQRFITVLGLDAVLNRRSASWRLLTEEQKSALTIEYAIQLMLNTPTLIKRPIISIDEQLLIGFNPKQYAAVL